jgi:small nuclear ribonucleoprotein (snRNP)-like protein
MDSPECMLRTPACQGALAVNGDPMATRDARFVLIPALALLALLALPVGVALAEDAQWRPAGTSKARAAEKAKEAEAKAKAEAEANARAETEARAAADADAAAKAKAEDEERAKAEAKAKEEAAEKARAQAEAEDKAKADARVREEKAKAEAAEQEKAEARARARAEAEERARVEAEARAKSGPAIPPGAKKITPPVYTPVVVHLKDGGAYRGTLEYELKGWEVVIKTTTGVERHFPMAEVDRVEKLPLPANPVLVHLKDGGSYKGTLIVETPGVDVLIRTGKGTDRRFPWEEVERVERLGGGDAAPSVAPPAAAPAPAAVSPAPPPPPPPAFTPVGKKGKGGTTAKADPKAKEQPLAVAGPPPPPPPPAAAPTPSPFAGTGSAWPSMGRAREARPLPKTGPMTAELVPLPPAPGFGAAPSAQADRVEAVVKPKGSSLATGSAVEPVGPPAGPPSDLTPVYEPPPGAGGSAMGPAPAEPPKDQGEWSFDADRTGLAIGFDQKLESDKVRQSWAERGGNLLGQEANAGISFMSFKTQGIDMTGTGIQAGVRLNSLSLKAPDYEARDTSWTAWKVAGGGDLTVLNVNMGGGFSGNSTMMQLSLVGSIGFLHAFGSFDSETEWSGFAIGADWAPSFVMTSTTSTVTVMGSTYTNSSSDSSFNAAGFALNFESGSMKAMAESMAKEAHFKLRFFLLPQTDKTPLFINISVGWVWY